MKKSRCAICPLCGTACGLIVEIEDNRIVSLRGDDADPHSRGHVCPKGMALPEFHADPDRLLEPMRKTAGGGWESVSWDEALDDIAGRLADIIAKHGRDAVAIYAGDAATHHYGNLFSVMTLLMALETKNYYTANSMDSLPRQLASYLMYGNMALLPVPDMLRTDYFLILGANPVVTGGSIMTAPGMARQVKELQQRGGRLVVVDPRRNETARIADEHYFIRPGTDSLLLLAAINTIFEERLGNPGRLRGRASGWRELRSAARDFTPESVSAETGMAPETIRKIARDFAAAKSAVCYGRMGVCAQEFGATASWLTDALNIVTGNLDRPGGAMFPSPAIDLAGVVSLAGMSGDFARWHSRENNLPEFNGELPAVEMAAEIETPGPRQIRALIVIGGNPAVVVPNSARLNRALEKLDFMVSLDPHISATGQYADYVLPPSIALEDDCYPVVPYGVAIRGTAKYSPAVIEPPPGVRHDWAIVWEITQRLMARRAGAPKPFEDFLVKTGNRFDPADMLKLLIGIGPRGVRASLTPGGRRITMRDLSKNPHGIDLGLHKPQLDAILPGKKINLAPEEFVADVARLHEWRKLNDIHRAAGEGKLILTSRRQRRFMNTCLHNVEKLASGPEQCVLELHPDDAAARGIAHGDMVLMSTPKGTIEVEVAVTGDVMPGVVSLPFGWCGRQPGARMEVANRRHGANVNEITDETRVDSFSGMSAFNGTLVTVAPVSGAVGSKSNETS